MKLARAGPISIRVFFDVPSIYVYLREPQDTHVARSKSFGKRRGLVLDFDRRGNVVGVQVLEPGALSLLFREIMPKYGVRQLECLKGRAHALRDLLATAG